MKIEFRLTDDDGGTYEGTAELNAAGRQKGPDRQPTSVGDQTAPDGLPAHILALRDAGFFREPRTPGEVHEKLLETYHCLPNRVQMALLRMQRRRELRKTVKKIGEREHNASVW
jgi:hypothetical protein